MKVSFSGLHSCITDDLVGEDISIIEVSNTYSTSGTSQTLLRLHMRCTVNMNVEKIIALAVVVTHVSVLCMIEELLTSWSGF